MNKLLIAAFATMLAAGTAYAAGTGNHSHGEEAKTEEGHGHGAGHSEDHGHGVDHHGAMAIGQPGDEAAVTRTIEVSMMEKDDGSMVYRACSARTSKWAKLSV